MKRLFASTKDGLDLSCPPLPLKMLSGRVSGIVVNFPEGSLIMPDEFGNDLDMVVICESRVRGIEQGELWVTRPGTGDEIEHEGRTYKVFGRVSPWWECLIAKVTDKGIAAGPGWMLVERDKKAKLTIATLDEEKPVCVGTVFSDHDGLTGEKICIGGEPCYEMRGFPNEWLAVRAPIGRRLRVFND